MRERRTPRFCVSAISERVVATVSQFVGASWFFLRSAIKGCVTRPARHIGQTLLFLRHQNGHSILEVAKLYQNNQYYSFKIYQALGTKNCASRTLRQSVSDGSCFVLPGAGIADKGQSPRLRFFPWNAPESRQPYLSRWLPQFNSQSRVNP
jgi:hypothetical protein